MADDDKTPSGELDPERLQRLVDNLRADKAALKRERDEARQERDAAVTERDEAVKAAETAKKDLATDRRAAILREFDIDEDDAEEFLPDGLTLDELRRKAERLAKRNAKDDSKKEDEKEKEPQEGDDSDDDSNDESDDADADADALPGRPKPALSTGSGASPKSNPDLDAIAKSARSRF